ncbi:hypothetical protein KC323_g265 [Hortaea werneckii]|nr:hypothetical protein KC323_g265 [Hortaea werneckii]
MGLRESVRWTNLMASGTYLFARTWYLTQRATINAPVALRSAVSGALSPSHLPMRLEGACGKPQQSLSDTYETMSGCVGSPAQRLPEAGRCCQEMDGGEHESELRMGTWAGVSGWEAAASGPKTPLTNSSSSSSSLVAAGSVCSASSSSGDASLSSESSSTSTSEPLAMRSSSTSNSSSSSCWTFSFSLPLFGAGSDEANPNSAASSPTSSLPKASLAPSDCSFSPPAGPASSSSSSETGSPLILFALLSSSSFKRRASSLAFSSAVFVRFASIHAIKRASISCIPLSSSSRRSSSFSFAFCLSYLCILDLAITSSITSFLVFFFSGSGSASAVSSTSSSLDRLRFRRMKPSSSLPLPSSPPDMSPKSSAWRSFRLLPP